MSAAQRIAIVLAAVLAAASLGAAAASAAPIVPAVEDDSRGSDVVLVEDVTGEELADRVVAKLRGVVMPTIVKAPGFGDRRAQMLADIAILVGGSGD
jgi:hypothetical protein